LTYDVIIGKGVTFYKAVPAVVLIPRSVATYECQQRS